MNLISFLPVELENVIDDIPSKPDRNIAQCATQQK